MEKPSCRSRPRKPSRLLYGRYGRIPMGRYGWALEPTACSTYLAQDGNTSRSLMAWWGTSSWRSMEIATEISGSAQTAEASAVIELVASSPTKLRQDSAATLSAPSLKTVKGISGSAPPEPD